MTIVSRFAAGTASAGLAFVGGLHVAWGRGSSWPMKDRAELADAVVGGISVPSPAACFVVGGGMIAAAALIAAGPGLPGRWTPVVRWCVGGALAARGVAGGRAATIMLGLPEPSKHFLNLDVAVYRPLCITFAALIWIAERTR